MDSKTAQIWMQEALLEAHKAEDSEEVPIGAVVLLNGKVVGRGHNSSIRLHDSTAHAEIVALRQATRNLSNYRIPGAVLVVTLEPCIMCIGAMIQARIETLVYGAADPKAGAVHSRFQIEHAQFLNHRIGIVPGILGDECSLILKDFFRNRRNPSD